MVAIATGRTRSAIYDDVLDLDPHAWILANGCIVAASQTPLERHVIPRDTIQSLLACYHGKNAGLSFECEEGIFMNAKAVSIYEQMNRFKKKDLEEEKIVYEDNFSCFDCKKHHVFKCCIFTKDPLPDLVHGTWIQTGPKAYELGPETITKGSGARALQSYFNIDQKDTIAFGDNYNDISMFEACGLSIAMGNSPADVKAAAHATCESVLEHGIWNELSRRELI